MPSSPCNSPEDATKVSLPFFSELIAECCLLDTFPMQPGVTHTDFLASDPSSSDASSEFIPPTYSTFPNLPGKALVPTKELAEIRVYFHGPPVVFSYSATNPPPSILVRRVKYSVIPYMRRTKTNKQDASIRDPSFERLPIDLRYVDFRVNMNKVVTRAAFMRLLRALLPPVKDAGNKYRLPEWHVVCLRCREVIPHHYTDKIWNGRYSDHRRDPRCKMHETKPPAV